MIEGSLEQDNLGLSNDDRQKLVDEVDVIFHCAATVRFNEALIKALRVNVLGTKHIVKLAKEAKNLKVRILNRRNTLYVRLW